MPSEQGRDDLEVAQDLNLFLARADPSITTSDYVIPILFDEIRHLQGRVSDLEAFVERMKGMKSVCGALILIIIGWIVQTVLSHWFASKP